MKKSNIIVLVLALVVSGICLAAWSQASMFKNEGVFDIAIVCAWWIVIACVACAIRAVESKRRERVRMMFVSPWVVYNPECGLVGLSERTTPIVAAETILNNLSYGLQVAKMPEGMRPRFQYVVHTYSYKNSGETWTGEVISADNPCAPTYSFSNRSELERLLRPVSA